MPTPSESERRATDLLARAAAIVATSKELVADARERVAQQRQLLAAFRAERHKRQRTPVNA
jgi:hypothetical protein